ncbi:peptidyl-prolyl cis-trans isomerase [Cryomorpha ignava]|uniref:Peptidyl-prolyl cis-trans isomerase n=1 Tax=Cryomorpha ignava TaxID=101383 RepID=A0A7K3WVW1_9FLAO|nr:peptidylprolyl isomerase [Cryomorpha ignava]NEN25191.1 peptidyl-prolyl cis-trans isomerase [Cryomorpha ignava]
MISKSTLFLIFMAGILMLSCKDTSEPEEDVVARVYDDVLLRSELAAKIPYGQSPLDSTRIADQIIKNWIHDKAVLNFAERNLSESQKDFSKQLQDYRSSLVTYAYERELINQKLDTVISDEEIRTYYDANIDNFKLKSYIVKLRFVKLSIDAPKQNKLEKWFQSDDEKDFEKLYEYCQKYAENFYFEENTWLYLQDVLKEVPINETDWDNFLRNTTYYRFESGSFQYLVRFFDYKLKDDRSPLSLERGKITDLILNRRKVELINKMREDVVNESYANKKIQVNK